MPEMTLTPSELVSYIFWRCPELANQPLLLELARDGGLEDLLRNRHTRRHLVNPQVRCPSCSFYSDAWDAKIEEQDVKRDDDIALRLETAVGLVRREEISRPVEVTGAELKEPWGATETRDGRIIVADTNNGRFVVLDKTGHFLGSFGEDDRGFYPNCVAVLDDGHIVAVSRASRKEPGQVRLYDGRRYNLVEPDFRAVLQHPRGVTIYRRSYIVVVEGKVKLVTFFNRATGDAERSFKIIFVEFPTDIVAHRDVFLISDNGKHCVHRVDDRGNQLGRIGCMGIIKHPMRVDIDSEGRLVVVDNHGRLNLTVFDATRGTVLFGFYSKKRHSDVLAATLLSSGRMFVTFKDNSAGIFSFRQARGQ